MWVILGIWLELEYWCKQSKKLHPIYTVPRTCVRKCILPPYFTEPSLLWEEISKTEMNLDFPLVHTPLLYQPKLHKQQLSNFSDINLVL